MAQWNWNPHTLDFCRLYLSKRPRSLATAVGVGGGWAYIDTCIVLKLQPSKLWMPLSFCSTTGMSNLPLKMPPAHSLLGPASPGWFALSGSSNLQCQAEKGSIPTPLSEIWNCQWLRVKLSACKTCALLLSWAITPVYIICHVKIWDNTLGWSCQIILIFCFSSP